MCTQFPQRQHGVWDEHVVWLLRMHILGMHIFKFRSVITTFSADNMHTLKFFTQRNSRCHPVHFFLTLSWRQHLQPRQRPPQHRYATMSFCFVVFLFSNIICLLIMRLPPYNFQEWMTIDGSRNSCIFFFYLLCFASVSWQLGYVYWMGTSTTSTFCLTAWSPPAIASRFSSISSPDRSLHPFAACLIQVTAPNSGCFYFRVKSRFRLFIHLSWVRVLFAQLISWLLCYMLLPKKISLQWVYIWLLCLKNPKKHIWSDTSIKDHVRHDMVIRWQCTISVSVNVYNLW